MALQRGNRSAADAQQEQQQTMRPKFYLSGHYSFILSCAQNHHKIDFPNLAL